MNLSILSESDLSAAELLTTQMATQEYVDKDLAEWKFGKSTVTIGNRQATDVPIYITTRNRKPFASVFHDKDVNGAFIYCLPGYAFTRASSVASITQWAPMPLPKQVAAALHRFHFRKYQQFAVKGLCHEFLHH